MYVCMYVCMCVYAYLCVCLYAMSYLHRQAIEACCFYESGRSALGPAFSISTVGVSARPLPEMGLVATDHTHRVHHKHYIH